jgi:hypothetical protein
MARTRSLLHRVEVRPAGRLCRCAHNQSHEIRKGEPRFVIRDPGPAGGEKGYCVECARVMLSAAERQLGELRASLDLGRASSVLRAAQGRNRAV